MKNNDYLLPGIAAITVAILSPIYWLMEFSRGFDFNSQSYSAENLFVSEMGIPSFMFLLIGFLSIYIYYGLMKLLHDHYNYKKLDVFVTMVIFICIIFYLGTFLLEVYSYWSEEGINQSIITWLWVFCLITFGIIDILLAVVLIKDREELSGYLKAFAIVNLVMGVFELTLFMSYMVIFIFPVVAALLAIIFLKRPETIEIV